MDRRPIGIFDSGLGSITVLRILRQLLPQENFICFGDTGRAPYGNLPPETILKYARQDTAFLMRHRPKAIIVACGTVTSVAIEALRSENSIPVFGIIRPAAKRAAEVSANGTIGLIATSASIRQGIYRRYILQFRPDAEVMDIACPLFASLVESGRFLKQDPAVSKLVAEYLAPIKVCGADTLILGCTHYPFLSEAIASYLGPSVTLLDAGACCAAEVHKAFAPHIDPDANGSCRYYVSGCEKSFSRLASLFLGKDTSIHVESIDVSSLDVL